MEQFLLNLKSPATTEEEVKSLVYAYVSIDAKPTAVCITHRKESRVGYDIGYRVRGRVRHKAWYRVRGRLQSIEQGSPHFFSL